MENRLQLESKEIMAIIPHRYPFLLVDRIIDGEAGVFGVGIKNVTMNEWQFQGHFPGEPVMPGVLMIEAMAQVGAAAYLCQEAYKGRIALFAGINKARFRGVVRPGDQLRMETRFTGTKAGVVFAEGKAEVDGKLVCSAELMFALMPAEAK